MKRIILGKSGGKNIGIDLDLLFRTRMLIQANSGGGKSWLVRRFHEQLSGIVPGIIIDPEGEFASLREKFPFVLVGKGGETPADIRSAALVAQKLLELRASAVIDLFEMKPDERHEYVKRFLESMINAPKAYWRKTVVTIDEAQMFCPEHGKGESIASEAVKSLTSRGRKRRFCAVLATQRLAFLNKDASALLLNRLVGMTFEDVDLVRALEVLSVDASEKQQMKLTLKNLEAGQFFSFGRAISKQRLLLQIGPVQTTHPDINDSEADAPPPPSPEKIRSMLPKLADLPQVAEEKARTEKELRAENRQLKADLAAARRSDLQSRPASPPAPKPAKEAKPKIEVVTRPVLTDKQCEDLGKRIDNLIHYATKVGSIFGDIACKVVAGNDTVRTLLQRQAAEPVVGRVAPRGDSVPQPRPIVPPAPRSVSPRPPPVSSAPPPANGDYHPGKCERELMRVLSQFQTGITFAKLSLCSGYSQTSSSYTNALGALRSNGIITGSNIDLIRPTSRLEQFGPFDPMPYGRDLVNHWLNFPHFGACERAILKALVEQPAGLPFEELAGASKRPDGTSYSATSSSYTNALGALRTAGLIQGRNTETIRPSDDLLEALNS